MIHHLPTIILQYCCFIFFQMCFPCSKTVEKNKQFSNGKKKFNMDPKKVSSDLCVCVCRLVLHLTPPMALSSMGNHKGPEMSM